MSVHVCVSVFLPILWEHVKNEINLISIHLILYTRQTNKFFYSEIAWNKTVEPTINWNQINLALRNVRCRCKGDTGKYFFFLFSSLLEQKKETAMMLIYLKRKDAYKLIITNLLWSPLCRSESESQNRGDTVKTK